MVTTFRVDATPAVVAAAAAQALVPVMGSNGLLAKISNYMKEQGIELTTIGVILKEDGQTTTVKETIGSVRLSDVEIQSLQQWYRALAASEGISVVGAIHFFSSAWGNRPPVIVELDEEVDKGKGKGIRRPIASRLKRKLSEKMSKEHISFTVDDLTVWSSKGPIHLNEVKHVSVFYCQRFYLS